MVGIFFSFLSHLSYKFYFSFIYWSIYKLFFTFEQNLHAGNQLTVWVILDRGKRDDKWCCARPQLSIYSFFFFLNIGA